ncbi:hypothetical protein cypCar_00039746 [Cyprinus carpio]|nr:hypothetical protein cypCar_00039746 [Cyprinus carpio]
MTSLQDSDPVIRDYMIKHSLPQIYKALLAGLCISCPEDPLHFIEEKILSILEDHDFEISWHTFIDKDKQISSLAGGIVYDIFGNPEDSLCLSHLLEKAYSCYRTSLTKMCFTGWKGYISKKKLKAARLLERMEEAEMYHKQRRIKLAFIKWTAWVQFRKQRQNDAARKLQKVQESVHCRNIITAWRHVVQDAKRTKEYFKRLERDIQESQNSEMTQGDGQDRLSLLPNKLSLKVFQSLGVRELLKCAQVCRSWRAIAQISVDGFTYVAEACSTLQQIVLDNLPTLTDICVQVLVSKCRMLTAISLLDSPYLSDVAFKTMAEVISLTKIQIEGNNRMTDSSLKALCRSSLKLSEVQMSDCTRMTDASLKSLGSLTKLCNLNISGCIK